MVGDVRYEVDCGEDIVLDNILDILILQEVRQSKSAYRSSLYKVCDLPNPFCKAS